MDGARNLMPTSPDRRIAFACGAFAVLLAAAVLVGWVFDVRVLIQVRPTFAPMQPNTAVCVLLLGLAVALRAREQRSHRRSTDLPLWLAGAAALIGGLSLYEFVADVDLGIDRILMDPHVTTQTSHPGRMAPNTALGFLLAGTSLLGFARGRVGGYAALGLSLGGAAVAALAAIALFGYMAGLELAYGWAAATRMALHTAVAQGAIAVGLIALSRTAPSPEDEFALGGPALAVGAVTLVAGASLWATLAWETGRDFDRAFEAEAAFFRSLVVLELETRVEALERAAARWDRLGGVPRAEWEADLGAYLEGFPDLVGVAWVDAEGELHWPVVGRADPAHGPPHDLLAAGAARTAGTPETRFVRLEDGLGLGVPLLARGERIGTLVAVFHADRLLGTIVAESPAAQRLRVRTGRRTIYESGPAAADPRLVRPRRVPLSYRGLDWSLSVGPNPALAVSAARNHVEFVLLATLAVALLVAAGFQLLGAARRRTRELVALNAQMAQEIRARETTELELRRSNEALEQFAYVASHDLQEPLRMVASYTQLLARRYRGQLDDDADAYIGFAVEGAQRMSRLLNDLLELSRISSRPQVLEPVDCNEVLRQVLANLAVLLDEADARVQVDPLPRVSGDASQLLQLFQNLVANAVRFRGDDPPEIRVSAQPRGAFFLFSVSDRGVGMEPAASDKIFRLFQRLERGREGTGIGLAIVKRVVESHGGRVWVETAPGAGSTFHFTLPAAPPGPESEEKAP